MNCGICVTLQSKYKCPKCRIPYCSLPCWKIHKDGDCGRSQEKKVLPEGRAIQIHQKHKATYNYPTEDTVAPEKLRLLEESDKLKNILSNPDVQAKLAEVDSAADPAQAMQNAMLQPIFSEFVDECMHILEPWTKEELIEERLLN